MGSLHNVHTRLGSLVLMVYPVTATPIVISAEDHVLKRGRKVLHIPQGGVLIPRRYGPRKDKTVMQVYGDVFAAVRGRFGASAYYGRPGRGKLYRSQKIVETLLRDARTCPDSAEAAKLEELAGRFADRLYATGRLFSRLEIWANALMLELEAEKKQLQVLRDRLDAFRQNKPQDPFRLRDAAWELRLAPFAAIAYHVVKFSGVGNLPIAFASANEDQRAAADDLVREVDAYLRRIEFERMHFRAKEIERAAIDDLDRGQTDDPMHYSRAVEGLLSTLEMLRRTLPMERQRIEISKISKKVFLAGLRFSSQGLTSETVPFFVDVRNQMKAFGEQL